MYFESEFDRLYYTHSQNYDFGCNLIAAYCVKHKFPTTHDDFMSEANHTFTFKSHRCGLLETKFYVKGWWKGSSKTKRTHKRYPRVPRDDELESLLEHEDAQVYVELFEQYLRDSNFVTIYDPPAMYGDRAIYQEGGTCFLAACLNVALHVPELRIAFFAAFRIKQTTIDQLTEPQFQILGNFAAEPFGTSILALAETLRAERKDSEEPLLRLGSSRALMRAFMLRIPGFEDLTEDVLQVKGENVISGNGSASQRASSVQENLTKLLARSPDLRGGIISAMDYDGWRHAVAFVRDMNTNAVRVYNWGVSDTRQQLRRFIKLFPYEIEVVAYSLPSSHVRQLELDSIRVKQPFSLFPRGRKLMNFRRLLRRVRDLKKVS